MAEVNSTIIKKTQEKLGKFVKKPPLTEKLLKKPPFRFLHDIIIAIIKTTTFFNELLLPEEFDSTNIKDRDSKIAFLQKIIDVVKLTTNVELDVKPSKIVAGLEPEKTNQLLQAIGTALEKKLDSSIAVATIKNGNAQNVLESRKSFKKPNETTKESNKNKRNSKEKSIEMKVKSQIDKTDNKKISTSKKLPKEKPKENIVKIPIKQITVSKNKLIEKVESIDTENEKENVIKDNVNVTEINAYDNPAVQANEIASTLAATKNIENQLKNSDIEEPDLPITEDVPLNIKVTTKTIETRKEILDVSNDLSISNDILLVTKENAIRPEEIQIDGIVNSETNILHKERRKSRSEEKIRPEINQINETINPVSPKSLKHVVNNNEINSVKDEEEKENVPNISNEKPEKPELIRNKSFVIQKDDTGNTNSRPRTSLRPPSVRPASARPGAPRRRDKNIEIMLQPKEIVNMAGINIKIEQFSNELEDDGENLVIIENQDILNGMGNDDVTVAAAAGIALDDQEINNVQKGHLVQQILETQKEYSTVDSELNDIHKTEDSTTVRENQTSAIQMDTLRELLQKLTRSVNPLGKLMDFLQEDIDSMQMELIMWRNFYQNGIGEFNKAKSVISAVIEPFKHQLAQIESNIKEQMELINISRSNILQNEDTILKLLNEL